MCDPSKNADSDRNRFEETEAERYDRLSPDETTEGIFGDSLICVDHKCPKCKNITSRPASQCVHCGHALADIGGGLKKAFDDETKAYELPTIDLTKKQAE